MNSPTILGLPSPRTLPAVPSASPLAVRRSTAPFLEPPLHIAAGTVEIDEDLDTEVRCMCDFGCSDCSPEPTTVWRRR